MLFKKVNTNKISKKEITLIVLAMSALAFLFSLYSNPDWFESKLTGLSSVGEQDGVAEETKNNVPEINELKITPENFVFDKVSVLGLNISANDQDGISDLAEQAVVYLLDKEMTDSESAYAYVNSVNGFNTCESLNGLPCQISLSGPDRSGNYETATEFLANKQGTLSYLAVVNDLQGAVTYAIGKFMVAEATPANTPPSISKTYPLNQSEFKTGVESTVIVSVEAMDADGTSDLADQASFYLFDESFKSEEEAIETANTMDTSLKDYSCHKNANLPCKLLILGKSEVDGKSVVYKETSSFIANSVGEKSFLAVVKDRQGATAYSFGKFEVVGETTEAKAPQIADHSFEIVQLSFADTNTAKTQLTAYDENSDLENTATLYLFDEVYDKLPQIDKVADIANFMEENGVDELKDCAIGVNLPCQDSISGAEVDTSLGNLKYLGETNFETSSAGKKTYLIVVSDSLENAATVFGTFEVSEGSTPPVGNSPPSIVSHQAEMVTKTPRVREPLLSSVKLNASDIDNNLKTVAAMYILDQELQNIPKISSLAELAEYFESEGLKTSLPSCNQGVTVNPQTLPCSSVIPESESVGIANEKIYTGVIPFSTSTAGKKTYLILAIDDELATDSVSGTFEVLGTSPTEETCFDGIQNQNETGVDCGGVCEPCEGEETADVLILLSIPLQDRDNNPATDRGTNSTEVWIGLYKDLTLNPVYTTKFTTNPNGEAILSLTNFELGNYIAVVKTSQHLSKALDVNLVAGENQITFPYLLAGDIAGNRNQVAIGTFDDLVNSVDIGEIYLYWGVKRSQADYNYIPDLDGNGEIGAEDFSTLISNAGKQGDLANK
ncbi:MAG: hypothetical protein PHU71_02090 [Candidatus Gracilibacteria bacterium]|nr:hypothetical protein [Candidatus Gracilibacteria bacterium]